MTRLERLGAQVKKLRLDRGWTQKQLIEEADVGDTSVERIEQARGEFPSLRIVKKIAAALGQAYDEKSGDLQPIAKARTIPGDIYDGLEAIANARGFTVETYLRQLIAHARRRLSAGELFLPEEPETVRAVPRAAVRR